MTDDDSSGRPCGDADAPSSRTVFSAWWWCGRCPTGGRRDRRLLFDIDDACVAG